MIYLTAFISISFMVAAFVWSVRRSLLGQGRERLTHMVIALLMLAGVWSVSQNQPGPGMLIGLGLAALSLGVLIFDRSPLRWLAFVQVFGGMLLAAGLPFATG